MFCGLPTSLVSLTGTRCCSSFCSGLRSALSSHLDEGQRGSGPNLPEDQEAADRHRSSPPAYVCGQRVWLSTMDLPLRVPSRKLAPRFIGPYSITKVVNPVAVRLILPLNLGRVHPVFHVSRVKPAVTSPLNPASNRYPAPRGRVSDVHCQETYGCTSPWPGFSVFGGLGGLRSRGKELGAVSRHSDESLIIDLHRRLVPVSVPDHPALFTPAIASPATTSPGKNRPAGRGFSPPCVPPFVGQNLPDWVYFRFFRECLSSRVGLTWLRGWCLLVDSCGNFSIKTYSFPAIESLQFLFTHSHDTKIIL
ncbi:uncharacterized protein LOC130560667 [Triplophysa rosa]|uniref:uncharacterized protein LOC130560667 n=1 Tax=Triplophysa rosa TaxID=992332 RepID=UPI002545E6D2|nr:uncharacterized protein LOC130560667 [Triplophysa rosa]